MECAGKVPRAGTSHNERDRRSRDDLQTLSHSLPDRRSVLMQMHQGGGAKGGRLAVADSKAGVIRTLPAC